MTVDRSRSRVRRPQQARAVPTRCTTGAAAALPAGSVCLPWTGWVWRWTPVDGSKCQHRRDQSGEGRRGRLLIRDRGVHGWRDGFTGERRVRKDPAVLRLVCDYRLRGRTLGDVLDDRQENWPGDQSTAATCAALAVRRGRPRTDRRRPGGTSALPDGSHVSGCGVCSWFSVS